jgi:aminopeptidase N
MLSTEQVPIMTNSESLLQFGNNAYAKPATALNILRETVLGRELFDFAFQEYARRWQFKRPMPADFFRTMEDASGVDLDWFWRGWFYTTDHCDISIQDVRWLVPDKGDPDEAAARRKQVKDAATPTLSDMRNAELVKRIDQFPELKDFYNLRDANRVTPEAREAYQRFVKELSESERKLLESKLNFYLVSFRNLGGLVMPLIVRLNYEDGSHETVRIPAEIWRNDAHQCSKGFISEKVLKSIELDPHQETADTNRDNNYFPPKFEPSRFRLFKSKPTPEGNPMREQQEQEKKRAAKRAAEAEKQESDKEDKKPANQKRPTAKTGDK